MSYLGILIAAIILCYLLLADIKVTLPVEPLSDQVKPAAAQAGVNASSSRAIDNDVQSKMNSAMQKEQDRSHVFDQDAH